MRADLLTQCGMGFGSETVQLASRSVEGVPAEIAGYVGQTIRRVGVKTLTATIEVLGGGCEGYWASLDLHEMLASGTVCASGAVDGDVGWLRQFPRPLEGWHEANGWVLDQSGWCYRSPFGFVRHQRDLRDVVAQLMLSAQAAFGVLPVQAWYLQIDPDPLNRTGLRPFTRVDLRRIGNGGVAPIRTTMALAPGCLEVGRIAHELGHCHLHTPCQGLRGCGTSRRQDHDCDGCDGIQSLLAQE